MGFFQFLSVTSKFQYGTPSISTVPLSIQYGTLFYSLPSSLNIFAISVRFLRQFRNSKGGENLFSKPSRRYVGLSRGRQSETLVPRWSFMGHCESSGSRIIRLHPIPMVHGTRLGTVLFLSIQPTVGFFQFLYVTLKFQYGRYPIYFFLYCAFIQCIPPPPPPPPECLY